MLHTLRDIKRQNKQALSRYLQSTQGITLDPDSVFDVQVKRLHEYKRQQMNALYAVYKYLQIKDGKIPPSRHHDLRRQGRPGLHGGQGHHPLHPLPVPPHRERPASIYYGTEIGLEGGHDPDCRRCMPWELDQPHCHARMDEVKRLIRLRRTLPWLRESGFDFVFTAADDRRVQYRRGDVEVLLNCGAESWQPEQTGDVLFARKLENGRLAPGGVCIRRKSDA